MTATVADMSTLANSAFAKMNSGLIKAVGSNLEIWAVCKLMQCCKALYKILGSNDVWLVHSAKTRAFEAIHPTDRERKQREGFWRKWLMNNQDLNLEVKFTHQAVYTTKWGDSMWENEVTTFIPEVGTLAFKGNRLLETRLRRDKLKKLPIYIVIRIDYYKKGVNAYLPSKIHLVRLPHFADEYLDVKNIECSATGSTAVTVRHSGALSINYSFLPRPRSQVAQ